MTNTSQHIRKAAVLIRSLDAETAARLLAQLPPDEAAALRAAVAALGSFEPDEQADVAAEMRRSMHMGGGNAPDGVELQLTTTADEYGASNDYSVAVQRSTAPPTGPIEKSRATSGRFEFLEQAPIATLVRYLSREHVQTIAVVLSYLSPARAAAVLGALPSRQQADTLERLSVLGETDADSVKVVEQELAAWVSAQSSHRRGPRSGGAANAILAAADMATRAGILANLKTHKRHLAEQFGDPQPSHSTSHKAPPKTEAPAVARTPPTKQLGTQIDSLRMTRAALAEGRTWNIPKPRGFSPPVERSVAPLPRLQFDELVWLDTATLTAVVQEVDPKMLMLALVGSADELVERIAGLMPRKTAKAFRKQLRKLGPTRLSDVEAAQQAVARAAANRTARLAAAV